MLPVTDLRIHGGSVHVPALVLLHFLGGSRREWIEVSVGLGSEFRVVSIDTPGFGDAGDCTEFSVAEMAQQFTETIAALQISRFTLVGHSMTGKVAALMAAQAVAGEGLPGLEKLVLLAPSPLGPEPISPAARATMLAQTGSSRQHAEDYIRANSALPLREDVLARAVEDRMRANPAAWRAWLENGSNEDWRDRLPQLLLPTLLIAAEKDASLGPDVQAQLTLPLFPNARMEVIRHSGHLVPMEAPEQLIPLLRTFALKAD